MVVRCSLVALLLTGACYRPSAEPACSVRCDHRAAQPFCPGDLTCGIDDRCSDGTACSDAIDGGTDSGDDGPDADDCPGHGYLHICPAPGGLTDVTIDTRVINTDETITCTQVVTTAAGPLCVWSASNFHVTGRASFIGSRAIVLVAEEAIVVETGGILDVSDGGAGANRGNCTRGSNGVDAVAGNSVGGGTGGSFVTAGGDGGAATGGSPVPAPPGKVPTTLMAGCDGGRGGQVGAGNGGTVGHGAGAIYLMAGSRIDMLGRIYASGGGGGGGTPGTGTAGGGGGGGSGGHIVLDAPVINLGPFTYLLAEGGGGGGGALANQSATSGTATNAANLGAAPGGTTMCSACGGGGEGSFRETNAKAGENASVNGAAGGGGGGAGEIRFFSGSTVNVGIAAAIAPVPTI